MIIYGWGKVTKQKLGVVSRQRCNYCNQDAQWQQAQEELNNK